MKKLRLFMGLLLLAVAILFLGCPGVGPEPEPDPDTDIEITALALTPSTAQSLEVGKTLQLAVTKTPANATTGITWSSSATGVATVSASGLVTAVSTGSAVITVASSLDDAVKASITVNVVAAIEALDGWKLVNQWNPVPEGSSNTTTMPGLIGGKVKIVNDQGTYESPFVEGASLNSAGMAGFTIMYYDTPFTGDFRFEARVRSTDFVGTSTSRGTFIGALTQTGTDVFSNGTIAAGTSSMVSGLFHRHNASTNGTPQIRAYVTRPTDNGAASPEILPAIEEYIFQVQRSSTDGYTYSVFNSQTGDLIATNTIAWDSTSPALNDGVRNGEAVYLGIAAGGSTAEVSNIKIWDDLTEGADPIFETEEVTGSPVPVEGVSITGTERYPDGTYNYQNTLSAAQADTILLNAVITPSVADDTSVTWSTSNSAVATVAATANPGEAQVTVVGAGTATITATATDGGWTGTYALNITASVVLVESITVSGDSTVLVGNEAPLSAAVLPANASNQEVTWSSSNEAVATVDAATGRVTGVAAGTVTITATAADGSGITGTHAVEVNAVGSEVSWDFATLHPDWPQQDEATAASTAITHTSDVAIGSGLSINLFTDADGFSARSTRWQVASILAAPLDSGFSDGALQPNGAGYAGYIENLTGPFTVTINYTSAGSSTRYPSLSVDNNVSFHEPLEADRSTGTSDAKTFVWTYEGSDTVTLWISAVVSGIRIYDLSVATQN